MVVLDDVPHLQVMVCTAAGPLKEYPDPQARAPPRGAVRYIEAKPGEPYYLRIICSSSFERRCNRLVASLFIDGEHVSSMCIPLDHQLPRIDDMKSGLILQNGQWMDREFSFTQLKTLDDDQAQHGLTAGQSVMFGTIAVIFDYAYATFRTAFPQRATEDHVVSNIETVPESALKGRSVPLRTAFTARWRDQNIQFERPVVERTDGRPLGQVIFKYHDSASLRMLGILGSERLPAESLTQPNDDDDNEEKSIDRLTAEEAKAALKELRRESASAVIRNILTNEVQVTRVAQHVKQEPQIKQEPGEEVRRTIRNTREDPIVIDDD